MEKYLEMCPKNVINNIFLYNSHPVADLFKKSTAYSKYNRYYIEDDGSKHYPCREKACCKEDDDSFRKFYFYNWVLYHGCDKCMKPWRECECWCFGCCHDRSLCRGVNGYCS